MAEIVALCCGLDLAEMSGCMDLQWPLCFDDCFASLRLSHAARGEKRFGTEVEDERYMTNLRFADEVLTGAHSADNLQSMLADLAAAAASGGAAFWKSRHPGEQ